MPHCFDTTSVAGMIGFFFFPPAAFAAMVIALIALKKVGQPLTILTVCFVLWIILARTCINTNFCFHSCDAGRSQLLQLSAYRAALH
jgi:hypothetical protein